MLVLSRKLGESIIARDRDTGRLLLAVKLLNTDDGRAKLGITAPADVQIYREEIDPQRREGVTDAR